MTTNTRTPAATTKVDLGERGSFRIWVRTRDWVATWKKPDVPVPKRAQGTPGIFHVLVNGEAARVEAFFSERGRVAEVMLQNRTIDVGKTSIGTI